MLFRSAFLSAISAIQLVNVRVEERDGRRVFSLTEAGREQATSRAGESGAPWEMEGTDARLELRDLIFQLGAATMQVAQVGSPEQVAQAKQLLAETRHSQGTPTSLSTTRPATRADGVPERRVKRACGAQ